MEPSVYLVNVLYLRSIEGVLQFEQKFLSLFAGVVRSLVLCSKTLLLKFPKFSQIKLNFVEKVVVIHRGE